MSRKSKGEARVDSLMPVDVSLEDKAEWLERRVGDLERVQLERGAEIFGRLEKLERKFDGIIEFVEATSGAWAKFDEYGTFRGWAKVDCSGCPVERMEDGLK